MVGELGPLTNAHAPVSEPEGAFAPNVILDVPEDKHCAVPAIACLGPALLLVVIITEEAELPHELVMVQVNVYAVLAASPVTFVLGSLILVMVTPAEGDTVQVPVSFKAGEFPFKVMGVLLQTVILEPATDAVGATEATLTVTSLCASTVPCPAVIVHLNT